VPGWADEGKSGSHAAYLPLGHLWSGAARILLSQLVVDPVGGVQGQLVRVDLADRSLQGLPLSILAERSLRNAYFVDNGPDIRILHEVAEEFVVADLLTERVERQTLAPPSFHDPVLLGKDLLAGRLPGGFAVLDLATGEMRANLKRSSSRQAEPAFLRTGVRDEWLRLESELSFPLKAHVVAFSPMQGAAAARTHRVELPVEGAAESHSWGPCLVVEWRPPASQKPAKRTLHWFNARPPYNAGKAELEQPGRLANFSCTGRYPAALLATQAAAEGPTHLRWHQFRPDRTVSTPFRELAGKPWEVVQSRTGERLLVKEQRAGKVAGAVYTRNHEGLYEAVSLNLEPAGDELHFDPDLALVGAWKDGFLVLHNITRPRAAQRLVLEPGIKAMDVRADHVLARRWSGEATLWRLSKSVAHTHDQEGSRK
jgi:hypothetical protein